MKQAGATFTLVRTIAERMKSARDALGLNQVELAAKAKVSPGTIGNLEAGTRKNPRELLAIAAALGVSPAWLKTGSGVRDAVQSLAQSLSHPIPTVEPKELTWERVLTIKEDEIPATFKVPMPDGALASVPKGQVLWFRAANDGEHDAGALFEVAGGRRVIRRYEIIRPGHFRAVATAAGYESFDSQEVELRVLAVLFGREGGGV